MISGLFTILVLLSLNPPCRVKGRTLRKMTHRDCGRLHLKDPALLTDISVLQAAMDALKSGDSDTAAITFSFGDPNWNPDSPHEMRKLRKVFGLKNNQACDNPDCCDIDGSKKRRCGRCQITQYCSSECQKQHWAVHKSKCVAPYCQPVLKSVDDATEAKTVLATMTEKADDDLIGLANLRL